ncbi:MAG: hypothetical protein JRJ08_06695 [Deltaproteobacteria bacterium]|nr:hypothetical protein [Deltaproteobacteria bacterium]
MRRCAVCFMVVFCLMFMGEVIPAQAISFLDDRLTISGFLKNETAHNVGHDQDFMKIENTFQIETEYWLNDSFSFFFILREFYDSAFDANPRYEKNRNRLCRTRGTDWMDVVCPTDQREYFLDRYADSRIPRWMLKVEYSPTVNGTLQLLFIPDFETNFFAPPGSPFTYRVNELKGDLIEGLEGLLLRIPGVNYSFTEIYDKPGQSFENSSFGLRWLDILPNGLEYTLNYLHGYGNPGGKINIYNFAPPPFLGIPPQGDWMLKFKYHQTDLLGFTFTKAITSGALRGLSIRGEFAYIHNEYNSTKTPDGLGGIARVDNYKYVIGLDKYFWTNWFFSFQFIQLIADREKDHGERLLFGPTKAPLDQVETFFTLKIATDFMHERIKPECLIMYGDDNDWRVSPRIDYELRDYLNISFGGHFFWGKRDQLLGEFRDNDQVYLEIKYGF